jgi:DNA-binding phage protein
MALHARPRSFRDARLFVIALEGEPTGAEYRYFKQLIDDRIIDARRVTLRLLPASVETHLSSPDAVLRRLDQLLDDIDDKLIEGWLVFDIDTWKQKNISDTAQQAHQKRYSLAISNPCVELWLLLHHREFDSAELANAPESKRSQQMKSALKHQTSGARPTFTKHAVAKAIERARALSSSKPPHDRWPRYPGTYVFRLLDELTDARAL